MQWTPLRSTWQAGWRWRRQQQLSGGSPPSLLACRYLAQSFNPALEAAIADRLSFRRFVGLSLHDCTPDHSTLWRFRQELAQDGLVDQIFAEIGRQFEAKKLVLKQGTLIDASFVGGAARHLARNVDKRRRRRPNPLPILMPAGDARATKACSATNPYRRRCRSHPDPPRRSDECLGHGYRTCRWPDLRRRKRCMAIRPITRMRGMIA